MLKFKNPFKRKNYASPYYGKGNRALFTSPPMIPQQETAAPIEKPKPVAPAPKEPTEPDWEQRRFELAWKIALQERRSVVLGKLKATDRQIASKARCLSDAIIKELQTHQFKSDDDEGRTENAE